MAISKITLNGVTQMDVTQKTVTANTMLDGVTSLKNDGTDITGNIQSKTSSDLTVSGATVTAPAGYYPSPASATVQQSDLIITLSLDNQTQMYVPDKTFQEIASAFQNELNVSVKCDSGNLCGYWWDDDENSLVYFVEIVTEETSYVYLQTRTFILSSSGIVEDSDNTKWFNSADANATAAEVASGAQFFTNTGFAIGSATRRTSSDLTASGATVTAPAGYYGSAATKSVASGTAGTPTASKGTVSNHAISVTPSVTNTTGYIEGGTKTGTAVSVSASELVSGTKSISSSGTTDVTNYASASVAAGSATTPATTVTANPSISVSSGGLITATASATKSVTPTVSAGYVSSGTAGTITVSGSNTSQLSTQAAQTIHPSVTDQTIDSGKYLTGTQTISGVLLTNLLAANIKKGVTVKIGDASDDDCVASVTGTLPANFVQGTFTGTTTGTVETVSIPYTGSGYPVAIMIYPTEGPYNSGTGTFYSTINYHICSLWVSVKTQMDTVPDYSGIADQNNMVVLIRYKNSTTDGTVQATSSSATATVMRNNTPSSSSTNSFMRLQNNTTLAVYIASGAYGFAANTEYTYVVIYSS